MNEVLRQVVAEELERLADADERLRLVTVTSVEVSGDLRAATVYVGTLDDESAQALEERRAQVQRAVGQQVRMKRTPRLSFTEDPAVSAGARVEEILRRLDEERATRGTGREPSRGPTAAGPTAAGPTAAGPTAAGPTAAGPTAAGPTAR